jgi:ammonia channel protein AmtB
MLGAAAIIVWGGIACCFMFGTLKLFGQLRVSEEEERKGKLLFMYVPCMLYSLLSFYFAKVTKSAR